VNFVKFPIGNRSGGEIVTVTLRGVESDVMLMTDSNLSSFSSGRQATYIGGHTKSSPVRLAVPSAGSWNVVVVPGPGGRVQASVSVAG
jgi:hypothetical protein